MDGHAAVHNFSRALTEDVVYPYEPTKDWMWYEPIEDQTQPPGTRPKSEGVSRPR